MSTLRLAIVIGSCLMLLVPVAVGCGNSWAPVDDDDDSGDGDDDDVIADDDDDTTPTDADGDGWDDTVDCDDSDPALNLDDADGDGVTSCQGDCDDTLADLFPGNPEVCDGRDNDCDGAPEQDQAASSTISALISSKSWKPLPTYSTVMSGRMTAQVG